MTEYTIGRDKQGQFPIEADEWLELTIGMADVILYDHSQSDLRKTNSIDILHISKEIRLLSFIFVSTVKREGPT